MLVPYGRGCVDCRGGCGLGLPYLDFDNDVVPLCLSNEHMRQSTESIVKLSASRAQAEFRGDTSVNSLTERSDGLTAVFDGYTLDDFKHCHKGEHPDAHGLPSKVFVDPYSQQQTTVWFKRCCPSFRWEVQDSTTIRMMHNRMPVQVYDEQPKATFEHYKVRLPGVVGSIVAPPAHSEVMRSVQMSGARQSGDNISAPAVHHAPRSLPSVNPPALAPPMVPAQPQRKHLQDESDAAKPVPKVPRVVNPAALAGQLKNKVFASSGTARGILKAAPSGASSAPSGAISAQCASAARRKTGSRVVAPSQPVMQSIPSSAVAHSPGLTGAALKSVAANVRPSIAGPDPKRFRARSSDQLLGQAPSRGLVASCDLHIHNTGKLTSFNVGESDTCSAASAELKELNKFERILATTPLSKSLSGANFAGEFTKIKRGITIARSEGSQEWVDKLTDHQSDCTSGTQVVFMAMWKARSEHTVAHINRLTTIQYPSGLPKANFAEWSLANAVQYTKPSTSDLQFDKFMFHAALFKDGAKPIANNTKPVLWCDHFQEDDLQWGIAAQKFCSIVQAHVLVAYVGEEGDRPKLHTFVSKLKAWMDQLPSGYVRDSPCLQSLSSRLSGILYLVGLVPYEGGCKVEDVDSIDNGKDELALRIRDSYLANELNSAWMLNAGESQSWPQVNDALRNLDSDVHSTVEAGVEAILSNYSSWSVQLRKSALPHAVHGPLANYFNTMVQKHNVDEQGDAINADNGDLKRLLSALRRAAGLFTDIRLSTLLQSLHRFASKINAKDMLDKLLGTMRDAPDDFEDPAKVTALWTNISPALPLDSTSILITDVNDKGIVIPVPHKLSIYALEHWHSECELCEFAAFMDELKDRIEIEGFSELPEPLSMQYPDTRHHFARFKSIMELHKAAGAYECSGGLPQQRVDAENSESGIKALIACHKAVSCFQGASSLELSTSQQLTDLVTKAEGFIEQHKASLTQATQKPVSTEVAHLQSIAAAQGVDGKNWRDPEVVPEDCAWELLEANSQHSLFKMDKAKMVAAIRSTATASPFVLNLIVLMLLCDLCTIDTAYVKLENAFKMFGCKPPREISDSVHDAIFQARRTVAEYLFAQALLLHETSPVVAVEEIKKQSKSLGAGNARSGVKSSDIHPCIFSSAQKVLQGKPFRVTT